jgi:hypothetical protein
MTPGTRYVIACWSLPSFADASNSIQFGYDDTSPTAPGNYASFISSWSASSTIDAVFYVYVKDVVTHTINTSVRAPVTSTHTVDLVAVNKLITTHTVDARVRPVPIVPGIGIFIES